MSKLDYLFNNRERSLAFIIHLDVQAFPHYPTFIPEIPKGRLDFNFEASNYPLWRDEDEEVKERKREVWRRNRRLRNV